ncbi:MAG TPA: helix-turn-helix transcriptional regulator [Candidatus Fournierella pullicola]|uniref:Helix-turn-helix transcriptional regulator n=1 Tax=Candidatus Allofournierella pullicola TaxID=2838596 RepID=A0A9D2AF72_9FIRM|nr:helix-turn-helix transcriptional regulator [Candidatus Fournierella pullicola]
MSFASGLYGARKKSGLSQEAVAEKLGVSRQTISKWETGETLPDIRQSKGLAMLYHVTLDELVEYDFDERQAQEMIDSVSEKAQAKVDWNKVWSKKYPVLASYQQTVRVGDYAPKLRELLARLRADYGYSETDALLVFKDILARVWQGRA